MELLSSLPETSPFDGILTTPSWFLPAEKILYAPVVWLMGAVQRPADQCAYMMASVIALISCFLLKAHPGSAFQRKLFSTSMGLFIHYYVFGTGGLASMVTNLISYAVICLAPAKSSHLIVFTISGITLALAQIHKQIYYFGVNGLDVPMNLMFNYCRVTSLVCCLRDGITIKEARAKGKDVQPDLKRRELAYAVEEVPSFFDFISYLYFCGAAISGPFYEFKDF